MAWNLGSDARLRGGLWWVALGWVGYSRTSDSLNCVLGCVGTCRAKTVGYDLLFWFDVTFVSGWDGEWRAISAWDGMHWLYWGDVAWICCWVEWSEQKIWQF